ncbi:MAG: hypothetical protein A3E82_02020 [Gammaproteobacteria bacterium RIFCSPHIGHO2_12_FULL_38_11]|nr:MAG: hypothetical protein A3E82_02020 [Gammaproteobacteria bacterium RIFCSPHIGHO2_12_FULL_38_11]
MPDKKVSSKKYRYEDSATGDRGFLMQYTVKGENGNIQTYDFHKQMSAGTARIVTAAPITLSAAEWRMFKERGHGLQATSMVSRTISTLGLYIAEIEKKYNLYPELKNGKYSLSQDDLNKLKKEDPNAFDQYCLVRILQEKLSAFYKLERTADPNYLANQEILKAGILKILGTARHLFIQTMEFDRSEIASDHILYYAECAVKDFKFARDPNEATRFLAPSRKDQLEPKENENVSYDSSDDESTAAGHTVFKLKGLGKKGLASYLHCLTLTENFNSNNRDEFKAIAQELGASRGLRRGERMSETSDLEKINIAYDPFLEGRAQVIAQEIVKKLETMTDLNLNLLHEVKKECSGENGLGVELASKLAASALAKLIIEMPEDKYNEFIKNDAIQKMLSPFHNLADVIKKRGLTTQVKVKEKELEELEKKYDQAYQAALKIVLNNKTTADEIKTAVDSAKLDFYVVKLESDINVAKEKLNKALRQLHPERLKPEHKQGSDLVRQSFAGGLYQIVNPIAEVVEGMGLRDPIRGAVALGMMGITMAYVGVVAAHAGSTAAASASSKFAAALSATHVFPSVVNGVLPLSATTSKMKLGFTMLADGLVMGKATYLLSSLSDTAMGRESYLGNVLKGIANNPLESLILVAALTAIGHVAVIGMGDQADVGRQVAWQMFDDLCASAKPVLVFYKIGAAIFHGARAKGEITSVEKENLDKRLAKLFASALFAAIPEASRKSISEKMLAENIHPVLREGKFDLADPKGLEKFNKAIVEKFKDEQKEIITAAIIKASAAPKNPEAEEQWALAEAIKKGIPAEFTAEQKEALFVARFADAKRILAANKKLTIQNIADAVSSPKEAAIDRAKSEAWYKNSMPTALAFLKDQYPDKYKELTNNNKNNNEIKEILGRQFVKELIRDKNSLLLPRKERWQDLFDKGSKHKKRLNAIITHILSEVYDTKITDLEHWIKMQETKMAAEGYGPQDQLGSTTMPIHADFSDSRILDNSSTLTNDPQRKTASSQQSAQEADKNNYDDLFFMMRGFVKLDGDLTKKTGLTKPLDFLKAIYPSEIKRYAGLYKNSSGASIDDASLETVLKDKFEHDLLLSNRNKTDLWKNFASDEKLQKQYQEITGKPFQADSKLAERLLSNQESKLAAREMWRRAEITEKFSDQGPGQFDDLFFLMKGPRFTTDESGKKYVEIRRLDTPLEFLKAFYPKMTTQYKGVPDDVMQAYLAVQFQKDLLISRRDNTGLWKTVSADHALQALITARSAGASFKELHDCEIKKALTVCDALSGTIVGGIANLAKALTGNKNALLAEVEGLAKVVSLTLRIPATVALVTITAPIYAASMTIGSGVNDVGGAFSRFTTTLSRAFTAFRGKYFVKRPDDVPDYRSSMIDVRLVEPSDKNKLPEITVTDFLSKLTIVAENYVNSTITASPMMKKLIGEKNLLGKNVKGILEILNEIPSGKITIQEAVLFVLSRLFPEETEKLFVLMDIHGVAEEKRNDTMLASLQRLFAAEMAVYSSEKKDTFNAFYKADESYVFQRYLSGSEFDWTYVKHPVNVVAESIGELTDGICDNLLRDAKILNDARRGIEYFQRSEENENSPLNEENYDVFYRKEDGLLYRYESDVSDVGILANDKKKKNMHYSLAAYPNGKSESEKVIERANKDSVAVALRTVNSYKVAEIMSSRGLFGHKPKPTDEQQPTPPNEPAPNK